MKAEPCVCQCCVAVSPHGYHHRKAPSPEGVGMEVYIQGRCPKESVHAPTSIAESLDRVRVDQSTPW